jgi:hypothetical protein
MQSTGMIQQFGTRGLSDSDPAFEAFRHDLIAYLACKLDVSREVVVVRLGDWLLDPIPEERRQAYIRANHAQAHRPAPPATEALPR